MKKIASITFHRAINAGAILQAYALQKSIESLGFDSEIIDYRNKHIEDVYSPFYTSGNSPMSYIKMVAVLPVRLLRNWKFREFTSRNLKLSRKVVQREDFAGLSDEYAAFFTGSDQVWNPFHAGKVDARYFLDFVLDDRKKMSYAASFGLTDLPEEFGDSYAAMLSSFKALSVREPSGVGIVQGLIQKKVDVVLDPVYLVARNEWSKLAKKPGIKQPYLLFFCVNGLSDDLIQHSLDIAKSKSLVPIFLFGRPIRIKGVKTVWNFAPAEFLGYIMNADYVITDSFHAMSFSIIFKKDFLLKVASQHGHKNNRSLELMERLGLVGRILDEPISDIDWKSVDDKIQLEKRSSFAYLQDALGDL